MVKEVGAKNDQTTCQKEPKPCATVAHYPVRTLKNTLDKVPFKEERIVGLPQTPEAFQLLPTNEFPYGIFHRQIIFHELKHCLPVLLASLHGTSKNW